MFSNKLLLLFCNRSEVSALLLIHELYLRFKVVVHPKNKHSFIYSPSCHSKSIWHSFFSETDTLKNISYIFVSIKNQWGLLLYVQKHFFKILSFVFYKWKESHTGLEQYWGWQNDDRMFIVGWTISLNAIYHNILVTDTMKRSECAIDR